MTRVFTSEINSLRDQSRTLVPLTEANIWIKQHLHLIAVEDAPHIGDPFVAWQVYRQEGGQYFWLFDHRVKMVKNARLSDHKRRLAIFREPALVRVAEKNDRHHINLYDLPLSTIVVPDRIINVLVVSSGFVSSDRFSVIWERQLLGRHRSINDQLIITLARDREAIFLAMEQQFNRS